jgi:hypothetical protein
MPHRVYYEEADIDSMMEDELLRAGRRHKDRGTPVDVDAFIENHLHISPEYVTLPDGVQGASQFSPNGKVAMKICAELSEKAAAGEPGSNHLIRTTLAHEAAHVLMHRQLFLKQSESLFGGEASNQTLCRDVRPVSGYTGEWWEWQANRGMGALLLPRREVLPFVNSHMTARDDSVVREVAERFEVSTQVVQYRFVQLGAPANTAQMTMDVP